MNYEYRMHDPRVGRFFSIDPLSPKYPYYTPYSFSGNRTIDSVEFEGLENVHAMMKKEYPIMYGFTKALDNLTTPSWWKDNVVASFNNSMNVMGLYGAKSQEEFVKAYSKQSEEFVKTIEKGDKAAITQFTVETLGTLIITERVGTLVNTKVSPFVSNAIKSAKYRIFSKSFKIGPKTLNIVSEHLKQFGDKAENTIMLDRMEKIASKKMEATEIDINFAKHELRENALMKEGMPYRDAHDLTLKEQGMYHKGYENKLYTKEAIEAGDAQMRAEADKK